MKNKFMRLLALMLIAASIPFFASCGNGDKTQTETDPTSITQTETETLPPIDGTTSPDDPMFSAYAMEGGYYINTGFYVKNGIAPYFDIDRRIMNLTYEDQKTMICSYDKNFYLSRIDTPASQVFVFDNTLDTQGRLVHQAIHSQTGTQKLEYTISYQYNEDGLLCGMVLEDFGREETLNTEFVYAGNYSYLIREVETGEKRYLHFNYMLSYDSLSSYSAKVNDKGDLEVTWGSGPIMQQQEVFERTSGESCKMFNEFCRFNALFFSLSFS